MEKPTQPDLHTRDIEGIRDVALGRTVPHETAMVELSAEIALIGKRNPKT